LKAAREKKQITYKGKPIKITDFSMETLKTRRAWSEVFRTLYENNLSPGILLPSKTIIQNWSNKNLPQET
jgi:hypothetical protein